MFNEIFGSNKPRCQHFSEDGKRCAADPQTNNKFCFMHDPEQKQKKAEARKKGGQTRFQPYEVKVPPNFDPGPLDSIAELRQFVARVTRYTLSGEMDQRSARTFTYMANSILAMLNAEARERYRSKLVADKDYRRRARERDPWSPFYRASERAQFEAEGQPPAQDEDVKNDKDSVQQALVTEAAAQSMRELEKLKQEEEKKQKERERYRVESEKPDYPDDWPDARSEDQPDYPDYGDKAKHQPNKVTQAQPEAPKPPQPGEYIVYGNSPFPPMRPRDTNRHGVLTEHMLQIRKIRS